MRGQVGQVQAGDLAPDYAKRAGDRSLTMLGSVRGRSLSWVQNCSDLPSTLRNQRTGLSVRIEAGGAW